MPSPLSKVAYNARLEQRRPWKSPSPEISEGILSVISIWSEIDMSLGRLLSYFVGGNHITIASMYQEIRGDQAKKNVLFAAAMASLPREEYALVKAVIESFDSERRQRNIFAHHVYDNIIGRDDCVVITDPIIYGMNAAKQEEWRLNRFARIDAESAADGPPDIDQDAMMVYTITDISNCIEGAKTAHNYIGRIPFAICGHPSADHMRPELLALPEVRGRFDKLMKRTKD